MITIPLQPFYVWLMVLLRTGFILGFFPLLGERFMPVKVRILLAMMLAIVIAPVAPVTAAQFPTSGSGMVMLVINEMLLGLGVGLIGRLMFAIIQFSGQIAGEQMGFGLINAIDPTGSHQISVVAELQYILSILIFLTADLHHLVLAVISQSYEILPPGGVTIGGDVVELMMRMGSTLFSLAVQLAMPIIVVIFAINVGLGMVARAVPQINVFMESFPLRIIAGLSVMMMTLGFSVLVWEQMFNDMSDTWVTLIEMMAS